MRLNELIGKPIVSADTGAKVGKVEDLLLDDRRRRVLAVLVGHGLLGKQQVLHFADIQTPGSDALIAKTASQLVDAAAWLQQTTTSTRASAVRGKGVVTEQGESIGTVEDLVVDDMTGDVVSLEVARKALGGLRTHRSSAPINDSVRLTGDVVVVPSTHFGPLDAEHI